MKLRVIPMIAALVIPVVAGAATPPYNYYDVMREIREGIQQAQNEYARCTASPTVCQNRYNRALAAVRQRIDTVASNDALRPSTQNIVKNRLLEVYNNQLTCGDSQTDFRACQKEDRQTIARLIRRVEQDSPPPVSS